MDGELCEGSEPTQGVGVSVCFERGEESICPVSLCKYCVFMAVTTTGGLIQDLQHPARLVEHHGAPR